jgi:hypothetical protein
MAGAAPAAFLGLYGDQSAPSSVRSVRDWPAEVQPLAGWGWGPFSAAMTTAGNNQLLSIGAATGVIHRFVWTDESNA